MWFIGDVLVWIKLLPLYGQQESTFPAGNSQHLQSSTIRPQKLVLLPLDFLNSRPLMLGLGQVARRDGNLPKFLHQGCL
jgi:hypothetical protein